MTKPKKNLKVSFSDPYADFLSIETPHFFNRVHNHSTWACAGVGMIGLVINDDELVQRALFGLKNDGLDSEAEDNDGGVIKSQEKAGFYAQMDLLFSPDGYYTEGPYYQRYAIYPFMAFANSLSNVRPELKIFEHREGILGKAAMALLNLADADGGVLSNQRCTKRNVLLFKRIGLCCGYRLFKVRKESAVVEYSAKT